MQLTLILGFYSLFAAWGIVTGIYASWAVISTLLIVGIVFIIVGSSVLSESTNGTSGPICFAFCVYFPVGIFTVFLFVSTILSTWTIDFNIDWDIVKAIFVR